MTDDRQNVDTRSRVHGALLDLIQTFRYNDITVSGLCKRAGISRGTFYLHYGCLDDALKDLTDDILSDDSPTWTYRCVDECGCYSCPYGICDRIRLHPEYGALLLDEDLVGFVTERISEKSRDVYVRELVHRYELSPKDAETLFTFQLNGCLAINRQSFRDGDRRLERNRDMIGAFILSGLDRFARQDP